MFIFCRHDAALSDNHSVSADDLDLDQYLHRDNQKDSNVSTNRAVSRHANRAVSRHANRAASSRQQPARSDRSDKSKSKRKRRHGKESDSSDAKKENKSTLSNESSSSMTGSSSSYHEQSEGGTNDQYKEDDYDKTCSPAFPEPWPVSYAYDTGYKGDEEEYDSEEYINRYYSDEALSSYTGNEEGHYAYDYQYYS